MPLQYSLHKYSPFPEAILRTKAFSFLHINLRGRRILASTTPNQAFLVRFVTAMKPASLSYSGCEEPHFLEACTLCSKQLGHNTDIFMYRGNTPFCSQECRQEQMGIDEERERRCGRRVSKKQSSKIKKSTGTLVVA